MGLPPKPPLRSVDVQDAAARQQVAKEKLQEKAAKASRRVYLNEDGDEVEEEGADKGPSLMEKVQEISERLRAELGAGTATDRYNAVSEEQARGAVLVDRTQIVAACGEDVAHSLKGYQLVGINFLTVLSRSSSVGGAILADEMGLGKTAQTIAFLGVLHHNAQTKWAAAQAQAQATGQRVRGKPPMPHLIVCPASLLENWQRELRQWCPRLKVVTYYGKERDLVREPLVAWLRRAREAKCGPWAGRLPPKPGTLASDDEDEPDAPSEEGGDGEWRGSHMGDGGWEEEEEVCGVPLCDPASGASAPFDVLLTTYSLFERDSPDARQDRAFLTSWQWSHLVADEAHALKNKNAVRTKKLMRVARACKRRILLTGTPLQNDVAELLNLLRFLMPSLFGEEAEDDDDDGEEGEEDGGKDTDAEQAERMRALLAPFILRRLKTEVAGQLVAKRHILKEVEMTKGQADLYTTTINNVRAEVAAAAAAKAAAAATSGRGRGRKKAVAREDSVGPEDSAGGATSADTGAATNATGDGGPAASGASAGGGGAPGPAASALVTSLGSQRISNIFTHLRKVALHPLLVRHAYDDDKLKTMVQLATDYQLFGGQCTLNRVEKEMAGWSDHMLHSFSEANHGVLGKYALGPEHMLNSGKVQVLAQLLPELKAKGSRVLLFSQWTQVLDVLEWFMAYQGYKYVRLDGSTQVEDRLTIVDKFNDPSQGVFVFLLSTRAGGQGLNLVGADTVILHDVDFNPQVDKQAEDRCHRLGQTRPVTVYRMVTNGSVDRNIYDIAERKLKLDAAIMDGVTTTGGADEEDDGKGGKKGGAKKGGASGTTEVRHMGAILAALLAGQ